MVNSNVLSVLRRTKQSLPFCSSWTQSPMWMKTFIDRCVGDGVCGVGCVCVALFLLVSP